MGFLTRLMLTGVCIDCLLLRSIIRTQQEIFNFRKQSGSLQFSLTDDIKARSLLMCSFLSVERNWDGFAFCKAFSSSDCFRLTATGNSGDTYLGHLVQCRFYVHMLLSTPSSNTSTADTKLTDNTDSTSKKDNISSISLKETNLTDSNGSTFTIEPDLKDTNSSSSTTTADSSASSNTSMCINLTGGGCSCPNGATNRECSTYVTDCKDFQDLAGTGTGYLYIKPSFWTGSPFLVRCEQGNTMIQMREGGSFCDGVQFNRSWTSYKEGFGNISRGCFWLGNDKIASIIAQDIYGLIINAAIEGKVQTIMEYVLFNINNEDHKYQLISIPKNYKENFDGFNRPDTEQWNVNGHYFHAYDDDINDCAVTDGAGWWYNDCAYGNLNKNTAPVWPIDGKLTALDSSYMLLKRQR